MIRKYRLAWTVYLHEIIWFIALAAVAYYSKEINFWFALGLGFFAISLFLYRVARLRAVSLIFNENGVWLQSGILPWNKMINGVKWENFEQAYYQQGIFSWLFGSYNVIIRYRFTNEKMIIRNIWQGHRAVGLINGQGKP